MKIWILLSSILILYFTYGFYISQFDVNIIKNELRHDSANDYYDYKGVINIHTDQSLGSGSPRTVISAAKQSGLDFILTTDLNVFDQTENVEGYYGSTLVMSGVKYSYVDSRLMFYSAKKTSLGYSLGDTQISLADYLSQKSETNKDQLLILAHPFKSGFSWIGEIPPGLDGFEIMNVKSESQRAWENSKLSVIWSLLTYPFNPKLSLLRLFFEPTEELALFDQVSQDHHINGYGGAEASARAVVLASLPIKFPSYSRTFELVTNHILLRSELTGNYQEDRQKIISALKNGNFYVSLDLLGDPKGFECVIEDDKKIHMLGSEVKFKKGLKLKVQLPSAPLPFFETVIYKNGFRVATFNETKSELELTEPGIYRVQVRVSPYLPLPDAKRWISWIYTNHFYVTEKK